MGTKIWRKIRRAFTFAVAIALAGEVINCSAMVAQAADAQFYIRYDGEPTDAAHASTKDYTAGMAGTISDDVVLQNENGSLTKGNWYYDANGLDVNEYGIQGPSASDYSGDANLEGIDFDNATITWYIIKYESDKLIHVDGVIKNNVPTPTPSAEPTPSTEPTPSAEPTPTPVPVTPEVPNTPVTPNVPDTTTETVEVPAAQAQAEPAEPAPVNEVEAQEPQENEAEADAEENEPAVEPVENDENEVEIEEEETPLAPAIEDNEAEGDGIVITETDSDIIIEEEETPLGVGHCWIHWLILILTAVYTVYELVRAISRNKKIRELTDNSETAEA